MRNTKDKLLKTAARLFARHGTDGVSTRELARQAGVNLCAISYYFGSKQKLYEAVIDDLISTFKTDLLTENVPEQTPREQIKNVIGNFFDYMCGDNISDTNARLMINEMISPTTAYDKIYKQVIEPVHRRISLLLAEELDEEENSPDVLILTHTLFGQAAMFRLHKEAFLRRMKIKKYTPELTAAIKQHIYRNCDAVIDGARRPK